MNETEPAKASAWLKTPYANLIRYQSSGKYFARLRVKGKLIVRSLKTTSISVAKLHEQAERRAHEQYGKFEERRRLAAEQAGETDALQQLEKAAKQVELLKPATGRKKTGGKTR
jgi:hypothetical protein